MVKDLIIKFKYLSIGVLMDMNNRFQIFIWSLHHNFGIISKVWMIVLFIYWKKYALWIWDHFKSMCHYIVFGNMHHKFEILF